MDPSPSEQPPMTTPATTGETVANMAVASSEQEAAAVNSNEIQSPAATPVQATAETTAAQTLLLQQQLQQREESPPEAAASPPPPSTAEVPPPEPVERLPAESLILSVEEALDRPGMRTRLVATASTTVSKGTLDTTTTAPLPSHFHDTLRRLKQERRAQRKKHPTSIKRPLYFQVETLVSPQTLETKPVIDGNTISSGPLFWSDDDASLTSVDDEQDYQHENSSSDEKKLMSEDEESDDMSWSPERQRPTNPSQSSSSPSSRWSIYTEPLPLALYKHVFYQQPSTTSSSSSSFPSSQTILQALPRNSPGGTLLHVPLPSTTSNPKSTFWKIHLLQDPQSSLWKRIQQHISHQWDFHKCFFGDPFDSNDQIQQSVQVVSQWRDNYIQQQKAQNPSAKDKSATVETTQGDPSAKPPAPPLNHKYHVQFAKQAMPLMLDYFYWNHFTGRVPLKQFAKLRRLLLPLTLVVTKQNHNTNKYEPSNKHHPQILCWETAPHSLADLLLDSQSQKKVLSKTQIEFLSCLIRILVSLSQYNLSDTATTEQLTRYTEIQQLIMGTCQRAAVAAGGWIRLSMDNNQTCTVHAKFRGADISHLQSILPQNRRVYSMERAAEFAKVRQARQEMLDKYQGRQKAISRMSPKKRQRQQQNASSPSKRQVVTQSQMSEVNFLRKTSFMHRVNASFARPFDMGSSRPRFASLPLSSVQLRELHHIFFDATTGQLRDDVARRDASSSPKNHYISFSNDSGAGGTDKRWQIPIRKHIGKVDRVASRALVEEYFAQWGIIDPSVEEVDELGILIGGTEDQSLHHDLPRDWVTWRQRKSKTDLSCETVGWESNRLGYNEAMRSPFSPSAMLISMRVPVNDESYGANDGQILVGVQKDQAIILDEDKPKSNGKRFCRIRQGVPSQRFEVVRENKYMYVLRVEKGCRFTGDFPHAGVNNLDDSSSEMTELWGFFEQIDTIWNTHLACGGGDPEYHLDFTKEVLNFCSATPRLDRFCRLYVSTSNKQHILQIPENTVGYYKCYSNGPGQVLSSTSNETNTVSDNSTNS